MKDEPVHILKNTTEEAGRLFLKPLPVEAEVFVVESWAKKCSFFLGFKHKVGEHASSALSLPNKCNYKSPSTTTLMIDEISAYFSHPSVNIH